MARTSHARNESERDDASEEQGGSKGRGAGRGIWSGSISFGLLQIPVTLYTAESRAEELHFRLLDKHDLTPIRYQRVNASTGKEVDWKDIVKGYEYERDSYVVLEPEDLKKANVRATQTLDIQDFVPAADIDPAFFETPYYVVPQKRAAKAYLLLLRALETKEAAAIATFVLRTREHLAALLPVGDAIMLEILRFGHELKDVGDIPLPSPRDVQGIADREIAMAEELVSGMMTEWRPERYRDRYFRDVMKMIDDKAKNGVAKERHAKLPGVVANDVVDLLDLLKKSVAKHGAANEHASARPNGGVKKASPPRAGGKKRTASTRKKKTRAA